MTMGEFPRGGGMGRSGVVRDGFSCWLLCLTDFHLPHPAALLYSALHLQRRTTVNYFILATSGCRGHKGIIPSIKLLIFATIGIKQRQAQNFYHP